MASSDNSNGVEYLMEFQEGKRESKDTSTHRNSSVKPTGWAESASADLASTWASLDFSWSRFSLSLWKNPFSLCGEGIPKLASAVLSHLLGATRDAAVKV